MRSQGAFDAAIGGDVFGVIRPDICKWGGLSKCAEIARAAIAAGKTYCPHYLGGGVGLAASAHLLAAVGGEGLLEMDVNENSLRDVLAGPSLPLTGHEAVVPNAPGLGYVPDLAGVAALEVYRATVMASDERAPHDLLFILPEQHRPSCLGCVGQPTLKTTSLDR